MPAYATTGDGVLTGLHLMARMAATGKSLAELAAVVHQAAAGADQRARSATATAGCAAPAVLAAVAEAEASWARPAGCCCARPAPSRWSG